MARYKVKCNLPVSDAFKMGIFWTIVIFLTAGVAGIFLPFFLLPDILNRTEIEEVS